MSLVIEMSDKRYGRWLVLRRAGRDRNVLMS